MDTPKILKNSILVVEDEALARNQILSIFQDSGYMLLQAEGVSDARKIFQKQPVDLVLLDNHLNGLKKGIDFIGIEFRFLLLR